MVSAGLKKRILCVEDHEDTYDLIAFVLQDYEVISARNVAEALRRMLDHHFDLYLFDYNLPDGTGIELCIFLRTFDPDTPIVLATASSILSEREVLKSGAQALLRKVGDFTENLVPMVTRLLTAKAPGM
jgi:two-component system response regulator MprA